jgi:hypothetical protein
MCAKRSVGLIKTGHPDPKSIDECKAFSWPNQDWSPYKEEYTSMVMSSTVRDELDMSRYQATCTTLCWSDRRRGVLITKCHERWLSSRGAFISITKKHNNIDEFQYELGSDHSICNYMFHRWI